MRTFGLCVVFGGLAFALAGYQAGLFRNVPVMGSPESAPGKELAAKPIKPRFPQDLAPAARAEPVPQAAVYDPASKKNRMAILNTNGALYSDWQERLREEWQAESVEDTALVIVVGGQKRTHVEKILYPGGAPPIDRYQYQVEASIIEAKTGKVLANRLFINQPRNIVRVETWNTTALGSPVTFRTVFNWAASGARAGFPATDNTAPIVNVAN